MYKIVAFLLNLPWTVIGFLAAIISIPYETKINQRQLAIVCRVKSFWWATILPAKKGVRGMALGHVVILGPLERENDLEHELIHVEQYIREPLIHFFLYNVELLRHGYRKNKYEVEAYKRAGNVYSET